MKVYKMIQDDSNQQIFYVEAQTDKDAIEWFSWFTYGEPLYSARQLHWKEIIAVVDFHGESIINNAECVRS
jgi:hypothetical protein